mgnify:FL=1
MSTPIVSVDQSEGTLNVNGAITFSNTYSGPVTTFLTGNFIANKVVHTVSQSRLELCHYTWDIPEIYHIYDTLNLTIRGQTRWCGEQSIPWDGMMQMRLYYHSPGQGWSTSRSISSAINTSYSTNTRNRGCGVIAQSHHADYLQSMDSSTPTSTFYIPNCPVSKGSRLKLSIDITQQAADIVTTNRALALTSTENGTCHFFLTLSP